MRTAIWIARAKKKKKGKKNDRHFECMQMSWVKSSAWIEDVCPYHQIKNSYNIIQTWLNWINFDYIILSTICLIGDNNLGFFGGALLKPPTLPPSQPPCSPPPLPHSLPVMYPPHHHPLVHPLSKHPTPPELAPDPTTSQRGAMYSSVFNIFKSFDGH